MCEAVVYVGVMSANHIAVVDTTTRQITRTIPAGSPNGMSYSKDFQSLFVSNALAGTVQHVSLTSDTVLKTAEVGGVQLDICIVRLCSRVPSRHDCMCKLFPCKSAA